MDSMMSVNFKTDATLLHSKIIPYTLLKPGNMSFFSFGNKELDDNLVGQIIKLSFPVTE